MFANILHEIKKEFPDMRNEKVIEDMFSNAVEQEIKRAQHILGNNVIGINEYTTEKYTKWLANNRLALL